MFEIIQKSHTVSKVVFFFKHAGLFHYAALGFEQSPKNQRMKDSRLQKLERDNLS